VLAVARYCSSCRQYMLLGYHALPLPCCVSQRSKRLLNILDKRLHSLIVLSQQIPASLGGRAGSPRKQP
jgi:hypothetical protein